MEYYLSVQEALSSDSSQCLMNCLLLRVYKSHEVAPAVLSTSNLAVVQYILQETTNVVENHLILKDKIIYRELKPIENPRSTVYCPLYATFPVR